MIVWLLDLQLPVQSVPITTNAVSSNPAQVRCTHTLLCGKVCQGLVTGRWFSPIFRFPPTIKNKKALYSTFHD
jgi:hypothetical protein